MEFHISRVSRELYSFDEAIFSLRGDAIFHDYHAAQIFANKMNQNSDQLVGNDNTFVRASDIYAMGLLDEIYHLVIREYQEKIVPDAISKALKNLIETYQPSSVDNLLNYFNQEFPSLAVFKNQIDITAYLDQVSDGQSNRVNSLEEMIVLWLENNNPAFQPYSELFDDSSLAENTIFHSAVGTMHLFFEEQPGFGEKKLNLIEFLSEPSKLYPDSLQNQLAFVQENWGELIRGIISRIMRSMDYIREEEKQRFLGPGEIKIPDYSAELRTGAEDTIKFATDREWMSKLVLIAKNVYVWLDQLSKVYGYKIATLDQIPNGELDKLRMNGITGLWLIGMWERSRASKKIKQMCGNPEALASAYSLYSYEIAGGLGSSAAYENLRDRAEQRGIRLGSDMVPNHMGIDSPWVVKHPEWFVQLDYSPFPSYQFNSADLSDDSRVGIYIEDHYYERTDAAVVFKHRDTWTGQERYIYHGNDGTSMPWNDTAQLNYLNPDVREAVIQTIVGVAKKFPIIRFDAAMTLTKKHYQRLWYPEPGTGGDIPSRAQHGMTKEEFDQAMPEEFWREVVERIEKEAPDTLLLAEAFWLMEGYFVRSLGMHRVYNSAFMNILRDEENAKYRSLIKETLAYEPQILQRYVNFMNNPDERTAVDQFGKSDKYFGICTLMTTFPGLPMFGHGQIEGFTEKYGMEYMKAYWDETPDLSLYERHQKQIFPLLHRREIFSNVENFRLYDFTLGDGSVNNDVFAYSNRSGNQRTLIIYHNRYAETEGRVKYSVGYTDKAPGEKTEELKYCTILEGFGIAPEENKFLIYKDIVSGLQFIHRTNDIASDGLFFRLNAYQCHSFIDFYEVWDDTESNYGALCDTLNGFGVSNIHNAVDDLILQPIKVPFRDIANPGFLSYVISFCQQKEVDSEQLLNLYKETNQKIKGLVDGIQAYLGSIKNREMIINNTLSSFQAVIELSVRTSEDVPGMESFKKAYEFFQNGLEEDKSRNLVLLLWAILQYLGMSEKAIDFEINSRIWFDEWQLSDILKKTFSDLGYSYEKSEEMLATLRVLLILQGWYGKYEKFSVKSIAELWFMDEEIRRYLGVNKSDNELWFNAERFEALEWWIVAVAAIEGFSNSQNRNTKLLENTLGAFEIYQKLNEARIGSEYKVNQLLKRISTQ